MQKWPFSYYKEENTLESFRILLKYYDKFYFKGAAQSGGRKFVITDD